MLAVAAVAGLLGWGVASLGDKEFPGSMRLDSKIAMPKYASMRDMEVVSPSSPWTLGRLDARSSISLLNQTIRL